MISNNYIPEKINDANAYLDGTRMIGVAASVDLPEVNMKTGTVEGFGVGGEIDSPTIGQWESFEQEVQFNTLYSSAVDMLNPLTVVNLTFRAAQQVYDKTGGYDFKGLRVVEMGRVKKFKPGKIEKSEGMEATVTLELTYIMIEVDGEQLIEIDKLNGVYKVKGVDMKSQTDMMSYLGGIPVAMSYGDVYTSLQTGIIDGTENNETALTTGKHGEVCKVYSVDQHAMIPDVLIMSEKVWKTISPEDQQILLEAAHDSTDAHKVMWDTAVEEAVKEAQETMGVEFVYDVDKEAFREATQPMIEAYEEEYPGVKTLMDTIEKARGEE